MELLWSTYGIPMDHHANNTPAAGCACRGGTEGIIHDADAPLGLETAIRRCDGRLFQFPAVHVAEPAAGTPAPNGISAAKTGWQGRAASLVNSRSSGSASFQQGESGGSKASARARQSRAITGRTFRAGSLERIVIATRLVLVSISA